MINKKLIRLICIFLSIIPAMVIAITLYNTFSSWNCKSSKEKLNNTISLSANNINLSLETQLSKSTYLANNLDTINLSLAYSNSANSLSENSYNTNTVNEILHKMAQDTDYTASYYLLSPSGEYIVGSSSKGTLTLPDDLFSSSNITGSVVIDSSNSRETVDIISPVTANDQTIAYVYTTLTKDYFSECTSYSQDLSITAYIYTSNGAYLFSDKSSDDCTASQSKIAKLYNKYLSGEIAQSGYSSSLSSKDTITSYYIIPEYGFIIIGTESISNTCIFNVNLVSIAAFIFLVTLIIAYILSSQYIKTYIEPLSTLKQNMLKASEGDLSVRCDINETKDYQEASEAFNTMITNYATNYKKITSIHKELINNEQLLKNDYIEIEQLAYRDGLTNLYNRIAFMKYSKDIIESNTTQTKHAILFIDLDNFKNINDTLGHDYGDLLLINVAQTLSALIGENDIFARTGGDEFLILKYDVSTLDDLSEFAQSLVSISKTPFELDEESVTISMSVGISLFPQNGLTVNELIKNADIAMYTAKFSGKNNFNFFNSSMEDEINYKNELIEILNEAIANQDMYLVYQPQADINTGVITGYEALMRLESPTLGSISPSAFIPVAEESGLISNLGNWALREACTFNKKLIDEGYDNLTVSVNVSTSQLQGNSFINTLEEVLAETNLRPELLELEITESVLMDSIDHNLYIINQIKDMGVKIALDDFGTGYSSFNYLTRLPINTLKIDKSFIDRICKNSKDKFISNSIISLAHKMDITVVAEGVEELQQLKILQDQMCDILQGYFFSKPLLPEDLKALLIENL